MINLNNKAVPNLGKLKIEKSWAPIRPRLTLDVAKTKLTYKNCLQIEQKIFKYVVYKNDLQIKKQKFHSLI